LRLQELQVLPLVRELLLGQVLPLEPPVLPLLELELQLELQKRHP
jgi:hypothetical protein